MSGYALSLNIGAGIILLIPSFILAFISGEAIKLRATREALEVLNGPE